ncbi:MAG: CDP-diacylglycerol--glycerol-3-phosphate 3-phosphatidyltransferase, partial [Pseudomonadota bacterium]
AYYLPVDWGRPVAVLLFAAAALTDWLDGLLARRLDQTSEFGAFLDPIADKLIVSVALVITVEASARTLGLPWSVPIALCAALMLMRELIVSGLRQWLAERGMAGAAEVSWLGKVKTLAQMLGLTLLLHAVGPSPGAAFWVGGALLALAALLACVSLAGYFRTAARSLRARASRSAPSA